MLGFTSTVLFAGFTVMDLIVYGIYINIATLIIHIISILRSSMKQSEDEVKNALITIKVYNVLNPTSSGKVFLQFMLELGIPYYMMIQKIRHSYIYKFTQGTYADKMINARLGLESWSIINVYK